MNLTYRPRIVFAPDGETATLERELTDIRQARTRSAIVGIDGEVEHFTQRETVTIEKLRVLMEAS